MNRNLQKFFVGFLFVLAAIFINIKSLDPDLGWHIRVGEQILQNRAVPRTDTLSNSMPGHEWVDHEWALDAFLGYAASHPYIWRGVILLFSALAAIPFVVWLKRARSLLEIWLVALVGIFLTAYLGIRPHIISFFLLFLVLELLLRKPLRRPALVILPVIFFLWANLHGAFLTGLLVFAAVIWAELFAEYRQNRQWKIGKFKWEILSFFLSSAATFANPYGAGIYQEIYRVSTSPETAKYIEEWQSPFLYNLQIKSIVLSTYVFIALTVFLGLFFFLLIRYLKKYPLGLVAVNLLLLAAFLKSIKMGLLFYIPAVPLMFAGLQRARGEISRMPRRALWLKAAVFAFIASFAFVTFSLPRADAHPEKALQILEERARSGEQITLFNEYGWGGYIALAAPTLKVFIDGRMPHWRDESGYSAMQDYVKVFYPKKGEQSAWPEVFARKNITHVLIRVSHAKLGDSLRQGGWSDIYKDETAIVLTKK